MIDINPKKELSMSSNLNLSNQGIVKSIECIKSVIRKLEETCEGFNGVEVVSAQFSPNEIMNSPDGLLDALILYLYCVHAIDWYSDSWGVTRGGLTVRQEAGLVVTASGGREGEELDYLRGLENRTRLFLQVFSIWNIFCFQIHLVMPIVYSLRLYLNLVLVYSKKFKVYIEMS